MRESASTIDWLDWLNEMAGDNSALRRRALAALILAESQRGGAGRGTRLPTERQLAIDLGVSRAAIRHAMAMLQAEGHVSREVGRGTFLRGATEAPGRDLTTGGATSTGAATPASAPPAERELPETHTCAMQASLSPVRARTRARLAFASSFLT